MKAFLVFMLGTIVSISCFAEEVKGNTISFQLSNNIKFENKTRRQLEFYCFKWGQPGTMFILNRNLAVTSKEMLKPMSEMMIISFKDQMGKQPGMSIKSSTQREVLLGIFSGTELEFVISNAQLGFEIKQYMFLLWDGTSSWNGQFSATSPKDISTVYDILKNAKRITKTE